MPKQKPAYSKFDFLNQYYKTKSVDQNQASLINLYLEEDQSKGEYAVIALNTPGCETFTTLAGGSVVRCILNHKDVLYAVAGNKFYSINSAGTATERGTLNTSTGIVKFATIFDQIMLVDGTNGYNYIVSTTTFATITDADFPDTAIDVCSLGETFFVVNLNSDLVNYSLESDGLSWDALSFFSAEQNADNLVGIRTTKKELWLFGSSTTECWVATTNATFPYAPIDQVIIEYGCSAKNSIANGDGGLFFLGANASGGFRVLRTDASYQVTPISTRAIAYQIEQLDTVDDAVGFCYQQEGHEFYVLTFPTEAVTFVYDITTGAWHTRTSYISSAYTRWRANCSAFCYGEVFIGDYQSGKVLRLDTSLYREDGQQIEREFNSSPLYGDGNFIQLPMMQIDFESLSSGGTVDVQISLDGGHTYPTARTKTVLDNHNKIVWNRCGGTRKSIVVKVRTTMNDKFIIRGAVGQVLVGVN